jgi:UDP-N-acetylmuramate--alanine ligase
MSNYTQHINQIYFLGIGGIGMSALAFHFLEHGKEVLGYDKTKTDLCKSLEEKGAKIEYDFELKLAKTLKQSSSFVIYTPAIKEDHPVFEYFLKKGFTCTKRAKALAEISRKKTSIAVAGTHGKTTITCMLGHILMENDEPVTVFAGGISENYQSNYFANGDEVFVLEADEFDRSFLNLNPDYAVISNVDADHLDIYSSKENFKKGFEDFAGLIKNKSNLYHNNTLDFNGKTIGLDNSADIFADRISIQNGTYIFDYYYPDKHLKNLSLKMPGEHNLFNALCALSLAIAYNPTKSESYARSLSTFKGVKRRFNYVIDNEKYTIIDDYAHHPTEINAVLKAIRQMHPDKKAMCIFQPHLYSRTRDFMGEFAEVLSNFDIVRLLDIYPAREKPIKNISSERLLETIDLTDKKLISKKEILKEISLQKNTRIAILGAGDIGIEVEKIKKQFDNEK